MLFVLVAEAVILALATAIGGSYGLLSRDAPSTLCPPLLSWELAPQRKGRSIQVSPYGERVSLALAAIRRRT